MEIRVLRYFLTVVREESITKAAEALHITQPTLSRQLAQLEEEVGVKLFSRGTRKIVLTNEGILLRRRAEEIMELIDKTEKELAEEEELIDGKIAIGCGELAAVQVLGELFASFSRKYPLVSYDLYSATADQVKERMDKGLTDIGLLLEPVNLEKYDFIRLDVKERWVAVMRPNDVLAKQEYVTAKDLENLPISIPGRPGVQSELASWFDNRFKNLRILITSNMSTNAAIMVQKGLSYALVIEGSLPFLEKSKICCKPLYPELIATTVFAWKRRQPFSLATTKFIEYAKCFLSMG
jgi:DNA-binding transcriptional LysR family regulator